MASYDYNDRYFVTVENTENGEVSGETVFHYRQRDALIWATYEGGAVLFGTLVGKVGNEASSTFVTSTSTSEASS